MVIESLVTEIGILNERLEAQGEQLKALTTSSNGPPQNDERVQELTKHLKYLQLELERRTSGSSEE